MSRGGNYCCLGVLSDLAVKAGICPRRVAFKNNADLNSPIVEWAGLSNQKQPFNPIIKGFALSDYNDGSCVKQKNFIEIADLIEKNL